MVDDHEPSRDQFPALKMTAIVEGGHSVMSSGQFEKFIEYCNEHRIKFYVAREKLPLLSNFFKQSKATDKLTAAIQAGGHDCPPPTFQCPQIDHS